MIRLRLPSPTVVVCVLTIGLVIWHAAAFAEKPITASKPLRNETLPRALDVATPRAVAPGVESSQSPLPAVAPLAAPTLAPPATAPTATAPTASAPTAAEPTKPNTPSDVPTVTPTSGESAEPELAEVAEPRNASPSLDDLPAPLAAEAIEEILRLRRAIAGPEPADGAKRGFAPDDQFRQALMSLTGQPAALPLVAPTAPAQAPQRVPADAKGAEADAPPATIEVIEVAPEQGLNILPSPTREERRPSEPTSEANDFAVVASLRETSRLLDNRAHDYDAERRFDEAEKLRRLAARLRKDARQIESTALAHEGSYAPQY